MPRQVPVEQALVFCFYHREEQGVYIKQCGSHAYIWKHEPDRGQWRVLIRRADLPTDAIWKSIEHPDVPLLPTEIYELEARHAPAYHHFSPHEDENGLPGCLFNHRAVWEYLL